MSQTLQDVVNKELESLGLELFELNQRGTRSRPMLDVRIERKDGQGVTVADCARASRAIEKRLDEGKLAGPGGLIGERYTLQISSPGIDHPRKREGVQKSSTERAVQE